MHSSCASLLPCVGIGHKFEGPILWRHSDVSLGAGNVVEALQPHLLRESCHVRPAAYLAHLRGADITVLLCIALAVFCAFVRALRGNWHDAIALRFVVRSDLCLASQGSTCLSPVSIQGCGS